jgi:hypothetical protein
MKNYVRPLLIAVCLVLALSWFKFPIFTDDNKPILPPTDTPSTEQTPDESPSSSNTPKPSNTPTTTPNRPPQPTELPHAINQTLASHRLEYTEHARCRMSCRHISESEINTVMKYGKVNAHKSEPDASPCPKYALEARTQDGQNVRIIFADCGNETRVITAIDLDDEHQCYCK